LRTRRGATFSIRHAPNTNIICDLDRLYVWLAHSPFLDRRMLVRCVQLPQSKGRRVVRAVEPPSPPVKAYAVPRLAMFGIFFDRAHAYCSSKFCSPGQEDACSPNAAIPNACAGNSLQKRACSGLLFALYSMNAATRCDKILQLLYSCLVARASGRPGSEVVDVQRLPFL